MDMFCTAPESMATVGGKRRYHAESARKASGSGLCMVTGYTANYLSVLLFPDSRVALCQRNVRRSTEKQHPMPTPNNRLPSRKQASCRRYCGVLTSALSHCAKTSSRTALAPDATHKTRSSPYRAGFNISGFPRHAAYEIANPSTGATAKRVTTSSAPVSHK
jgi:hypothetical protein